MKNKQNLIILIGILIILGVFGYGLYLYKNQISSQSNVVKPIVSRTLAEKRDFLFNNCQLSNQNQIYRVCSYGLNDRLIESSGFFMPGDELGLRVNLNKLAIARDKYLCVETILLDSEEVKTPLMEIKYADRDKDIFRACTSGKLGGNADLFIFGVAPALSLSSSLEFKIFGLTQKLEPSLLEKEFDPKDLILKVKLGELIKQ